MQEQASRLGLYSRNLGLKRASSRTYWPRCMFLAQRPAFFARGQQNLKAELMMRLKPKMLIISASVLRSWAAVYWLAQAEMSCLTVGTWQVSSNLAAIKRAAAPTSCSSARETVLEERQRSMRVTTVKRVSGNILYLQCSSASHSMSLALEFSERTLWEARQLPRAGQAASWSTRKRMFQSKYSGTIWELGVSGLSSLGLGTTMDLLRVETGALRSLSLSWWIMEQFLLQRWASCSRRLVSYLPKTLCSICLLDQYYNFGCTANLLIQRILISINCLCNLFYFAERDAQEGILNLYQGWFFSQGSRGGHSSKIKIMIK